MGQGGVVQAHEESCEPHSGFRALLKWADGIWHIPGLRCGGQWELEGEDSNELAGNDNPGETSCRTDLKAGVVPKAWRNEYKQKHTKLNRTLHSLSSRSGCGWRD